MRVFVAFVVLVAFGVFTAPEAMSCERPPTAPPCYKPRPPKLKPPRPVVLKPGPELLDLQARVKADADRAEHARTEAESARDRAEPARDQASDAKRAAEQAAATAVAAANRAELARDQAISAQQAAEQAATTAVAAANRAELARDRAENAAGNAAQLVADARSEMQLIIQARDDLRTERGLGLEMLFKRAVEDMLGSDIKEESNRLAVVDYDNKTFLRDLFPRLWGRIQERRKSDWEIDERKPAIQNYGLRKWDNRNMVSAFFKLDFKFRNAKLGRHERECFILNYVRDEKFRMLRDPWMTACDNFETQVKTRKEQIDHKDVWQRS